MLNTTLKGVSIIKREGRWCIVLRRARPHAALLLYKALKEDFWIFDDGDCVGFYHVVEL